MNTRTVAGMIGTEPATLRKFLRDPSSTFRAVGSGARYEFEESDIPTLKRKFNEWAKGQTKETKVTTKRAPHTTSKTPKPEVDQAVWDDEAEVTVPDVRDPRVRARVRAREEEARRWLRERIDARI